MAAPAVVVFTPWFLPHRGGVETTVDLLARELAAAGCPVTVLTTYADDGPEPPRPFRVLRRPGVAAAWRAVRHADVVLMLGPSLRFLGLPLLQRKPLVINHFSWIDWRPRPATTALQRFLARAACNVAPSADLANHVGGTMMPNPFDDAVFREYPDVPRDRDLVFLGRLTQDKGLAVLFEALRLLRDGDAARRLTVIGGGPDRAALEQRAVELGVDDAVRWLGVLSGEPLARELARHRTVVVPSLCREAFGIVVLEGLACGCEIVCSDHGGLPEAAGGLAELCPPGNVARLAAALRAARARGAPSPTRRDAHLAQFRAAIATRSYLDLFRRLAER